MAELKCDFPDGCKLDLWAKVVKAKYIEKQAQILDTTFCIPDCGPDGVGGMVQLIDDIKVKVRDKYCDLNFNKVKIYIDYEIILFVKVDGNYQIVTVNDIYEQTFELDQFDPPLTVEEFRNSIKECEIVTCNWSFDYELKGNCMDPCSPCAEHFPVPQSGTCLQLVVYTDLVVKLGKMHDIIVYGELDPDVEC